MGYNKKYHLQRVLKFQEFVQEVQNDHKGLPLTKVYSLYVKDKFDISYSTFTKWLGINAKREINKTKHPHCTSEGGVIKTEEITVIVINQ